MYVYNIARTINSRVGRIMSQQDFRVGREFADDIIVDEVANGNYQFNYHFQLLINKLETNK